MSHITDLAAAQQANLLTSPSGVQYSNNSNMPLELAILCMYYAENGYSGNPPREGKLSVTTLIGPLRKAIYSILYPLKEDVKDVSTLIASSKGTAMHEALTKALEWYGGYSCELRNNIVVNGWKISGEYDVKNPASMLKDLKFVSNYNYKKLVEEREAMQPGLSIEEMLQQFPTYTKFQLQLSIYRLLELPNDELVKSMGSILMMLNNGGDFGKCPTESEHVFPLYQEEELTEFIHNRVEQIKQHLDDGTLPLCSDTERGKSEGEYKLERMGPSGKFATVRGSKCTSMGELQNFIRLKGKPGDRPVEKPPEYKLCNYCAHNQICDQI